MLGINKYCDLTLISNPSKTFRRITNLSLIKDVAKANNGQLETVKHPNAFLKLPLAPKSVDTLVFSLTKWAIQNNITNAALKKLLNILFECGIQGLPKNHLHLFKIRMQEMAKDEIPPGTYCHYGLTNNLYKLVSHAKKLNLFNQTNVDVSIFIDELSMLRVKNQSWWFILGSVEGIQECVFLIGAYQGPSKPEDPNLFLQSFVEETKSICQNGLLIDNELYNVRIKRLICDANAKSYLLNINHFLSYSSCTKCTSHGIYKKKNICFFEKGSPRTNKDFLKEDIYLNQRKTSLLKIPNFGVVSNVVIDYAHLVCLGVMKRLLTLWFYKNEFFICKTSIQKKFKNFIKLYPVEFTIKPYMQKYLSKYVINFFREFLLYFGPVVLKNNMDHKSYEHFLLLHVACRLLCIEASPQNVLLGKCLLNRFVQNYPHLYKDTEITHNIHGLYHLADDCIIHGTLDNFSSIRYEKNLFKLKNLMSKSIGNRVSEVTIGEFYEKIYQKSFNYITPKDHLEVKKEIQLDNKFKGYTSFEELKMKNFSVIPKMQGNEYVLLNNQKIVKVSHILKKNEFGSKNIYIAGEEILITSTFHSPPYDKLELDMFETKEGSTSKSGVDIWPADLIHRKCMKLPVGHQNSVMIGLLDENH